MAVIDAALAAGLAGGYQEAVESNATLDDGFDPLERGVLLATLGAGAEAIEEAQRHGHVFACPDHPVGATILSVLEEMATDFGTVIESPVDGKEVKFDGADLAGWASAAWPRIKQLLNQGRVDFPPGPTQPTVIPNGARVAILGDWGTGLYGAPHCAASIAADPQSPDVLIHLGDVYYTGTETQIRERFLRPWPNVPGSVSRACNSNHEMLSGGAPFRDITLKKFEQSSSLWWLQNDAWDLIGLDTGWDDGKVGQLQISWLERILRQSREAGRGSIAFSHHMPWRTDKHNCAKDPLDQVRHLLDQRLLDGWYFGHEHVCALFERHPRWRMFSACIGHSGYPYWPVDKTGRTQHRSNPDGSTWWHHPATEDVPGSYLLYGDNKFVTGHETQYGPNGYAMLDLGVREWVESVHEPKGTRLSRRTLNTSGAGCKGDLPQ